MWQLGYLCVKEIGNNFTAESDYFLTYFHLEHKFLHSRASGYILVIAEELSSLKHSLQYYAV